ncbi:Uncharacterised protein [Mycobacterium tuberculosis]|nr:Uncharacterised protein [Mycobacterium tuberculosis]
MHGPLWRVLRDRVRQPRLAEVVRPGDRGHAGRPQQAEDGGEVAGPAEQWVRLVRDTVPDGRRLVPQKLLLDDLQARARIGSERLPA